MTEVTPDDLNGKCLAKASTKSKSIYDKTNMLLKMIFGAAEKSNIITSSPAENLNPKGGKAAKRAYCINRGANRNIIKCNTRFSTISVCYDRLICRFTPGRDSCTEMGL